MAHVDDTAFEISIERTLQGALNPYAPSLTTSGVVSSHFYNRRRHKDTAGYTIRQLSSCEWRVAVMKNVLAYAGVRLLVTP